MKGLLYKDFALLQNMGKSYLLMMAIFFALTLVGLYDPAILFVMLAVMLCMFPTSSFTYDEMAKWDRFAIATPGGRANVVKAKYAFSILLAGATFLLNLLLMVTLLLLGKLEYALFDGLLIALSGVVAALVLNAFLLPFLFRLGAQKARVVMIASIAIAGGAGGALIAIIGMSYSGPILNSLLLPLLVSVAALLTLWVSYRISLRIYSKKEF